MGPVLFLVYINDLPDYLTHSKLRLFADDTIIYRPIKSQNDCDNLQVDLDAAASWERDWLMVSVHPDKCTVLSVTKKKRPIQHNYILNGHTLESVTSAKYLGVTIQSNLKWDKHINDITSKGNISLGFLHLQTSKDSYRHSYFPYSIPQWNQLLVVLVQAPSINSFKEQLTSAVFCSIN